VRFTKNIDLLAQDYGSKALVKTMAVVFLIVLALNLFPAFAPPTWMAMSWIGFNLRDGNPFVLAVVAASAATMGRLLLATSARKLVRGKLMRDDDRRNIDAAAAWLEKHSAITVGSFLLYALSPLPSNYLFIAYGLSRMPLKRIGVAFFIGRGRTSAALPTINLASIASLRPGISASIS